MAFITPYDTDESITYKGDVINTHLPTAIWLKDDFTGKEAIGRIKVTIKETNKKAIKNPSGYYLFTERGSYTVCILSDLYFLEKTQINIPVLNFDTNGPASGVISAKLKDVSKLHEGDIVEFYNLIGNKEQKNITVIDTTEKTISWLGGLKYDFTAKGSAILALKKDPVVPVLLKPLPSYPFPNNATLVRGLIFDSSENPVVNARVKVEGQDVETKSDNNGEFVLYFKNKIGEKISIEIDGDSNSIDANLEEGMTKTLDKIILS